MSRVMKIDPAMLEDTNPTAIAEARERIGRRMHWREIDAMFDVMGVEDGMRRRLFPERYNADGTMRAPEDVPVSF